MSLNNRYNQIAVKVIYCENKGSGWMYNPPNSEYTYIFTAKHCFCNDEMNKENGKIKLETIIKENIDINNITIKRFISRRDGWENEEYYKVKEIYLAEGGIDLAIILIDRKVLSDNVILLSAKENVKKRITLFGYPTLIEQAPIPYKKLDDFTINNIEDDGYIEIKHENLDTFDFDSKRAMDSLSGSGMFIYNEKENKIYSIGTYTGLSAPGAAYNHYSGEGIESIQAVVDENNLDKVEVIENGEIIQFNQHYLSIDQWEKDNPNLYTRKWFETESSANIIENIKIHFDDNNNDNIIYILGPSGSGKTRTVYEACKRYSSKLSIMYFKKYNEQVINVLNSLKNINNKYYIVIDEVDAGAYQEINSKFAIENLRIILIGVAKEYEQYNDSSIIYKESPTEIEMQKIITVNTENFLNKDQVQKICLLAKSDLRLAFLIGDIWKKDGEVSIGGDNSVTSYSSLNQIFNRILFQYRDVIGNEEAFKKNYSILCTLLDIEYKGKDVNEIELLAKYYGVSKLELLRTIDIATKCLLGEERYNYFEACPRVLSTYLFEKEIWPSLKGDIIGFINSINDIMRKRFRDRILECNDSIRREGEEAFASRFLDIYSKFDLELINSKDKAKVFRLESEFIPKVSLEWLNKSLQLALKEKRNLNTLCYGTRRNIVWMLEHLIVFKDCFYECEKSLLLLAENETEIGLYNNSAGVWVSLFRILLSNTSLSFDERSKLFFKRMNDISCKNYNLITKAITSILINNTISTIIPPKVIGGRLVPKLWEPRADELESIKECFLDQLIAQLRVIEDEKHEILIDYFIDNIYSFIVNGYGEKIINYMLNCNRIKHERLILLRAIMENNLNAFFQLNDNKDVNNAHDQYIINFLINKIKLIKLYSVDDKFLLAINLVYYRLDENNKKKYIDDLAQEIVTEKVNLDKYTEYFEKLKVNETINEIFYKIGQIDKAQYYSSYICDLFRKKILTNLVIKYMSGIKEEENSTCINFSKLLDEYEDIEPEYVLYIIIFSDLSKGGFDRIINIINKGISNYNVLNNLRYYEWNQFLDENKKIFLFRCLKNKARNDTNLVILYLNSLWNNKTISNERAEIVLDILKNSINNTELWIWESNIKLISNDYDKEKIDILINSFLESNSSDREESIINMIEEYGSKYSYIIVPKIGNAMLIKNDFIPKSYKGFFEIFNIEDVQKWVNDNGEEAAIIVARHMLSPKSIDTDQIYVPELTRWILEKFETSDKVYCEFIRSRYAWVVYSVGEIIENYDKLVQEKKAYLNHPLRRIREWAKYEINRYNQIMEDNKKMKAIDERNK